MQGASHAGSQDDMPCDTDNRSTAIEDIDTPKDSSEAGSMPPNFLCFLLAVLVTTPVAAELCPLAAPLLWLCMAAVVIIDGTQAHITFFTILRDRHTIAQSVKQYAGETAYWLITTAARCLLNVALLTGVAIVCCCSIIINLAQQQKTLLAVITTQCLMCRAQHMIASGLSATWASGYAALLVEHATQSQTPASGFLTILSLVPSSLQTQMTVLIVTALLLAALIMYLVGSLRLFC